MKHYNNPDDINIPEAKDEPSFQDEQNIIEDTKKLQEKINAEQERDKEGIKDALQRNKEDFMRIAGKHGFTGNPSEIQEMIKNETEQLAELQSKLMDELDTQKAELEIPEKETKREGKQQ